MIFCQIKNNKHNSAERTFKCEVDGMGDELLFEAMRINASLIIMMRKVGMSDDAIENQLAYNLVGGFHIAEDIEKQRRASK